MTQKQKEKGHRRTATEHRRDRGKVVVENLSGQALGGVDANLVPTLMVSLSAPGRSTTGKGLHVRLDAASIEPLQSLLSSRRAEDHYRESGVEMWAGRE